MSKRLLIVDDETSIADLMEEFVKIQIPDATVFKANYGDHAMVALKKDWDVVVTDNNLPNFWEDSPKTTGLDIVEICKKKNIPVILTSGRLVETDVPFFLKPAISEIVPLVKEWLNSSQEETS